MIPGDVYPVLRVTTEYYLRGFELLGQAQETFVGGLIAVTLAHSQLSAPDHGPISVRGLSRRLGMPFETVRRHSDMLVKSGQCVAEKDGLVVPAAVLRGRWMTEFLRKVYVNAVRVLLDLQRIRVARFDDPSLRTVRSRGLTRNQTVIALAATGLLLAGMRAVRQFWGGDFNKGLVYTAVWTANIKHVTNSGPAGEKGILKDAQRLPVSGLTLSHSLRLPYETVRRHAHALVREGICERVGRQGLIVPEHIHRNMTAGATIAYQLMADFLAELRGAGFKV